MFFPMSSLAPYGRHPWPRNAATRAPRQLLHASPPVIFERQHALFEENHA